jgi:hypothetical protein
MVLQESHEAQAVDPSRWGSLDDVNCAFCRILRDQGVGADRV